MVSTAIRTFDGVPTVEAIMTFLCTSETNQSAPALAFTVPELLAGKTPGRVWYIYVHTDTEGANKDGLRNRWSVKRKEVRIQVDDIPVFLYGETFDSYYSL